LFSGKIKNSPPGWSLAPGLRLRRTPRSGVKLRPRIFKLSIPNPKIMSSPIENRDHKFSKMGRKYLLLGLISGVLVLGGLFYNDKMI